MGSLPLLGIKETCLYVGDLTRTRRFYENVLGLPCFSFVPESHAFFRAGYSVLLCFLPDVSREQTRLPRHFAEGEPHFALEVDRAHYAAWRERLTSAGVNIEHDHVWNGGFRSFYFRDPDRACVEVIEAGMWEYRGQERTPTA